MWYSLSMEGISSSSALSLLRFIFIYLLRNPPHPSPGTQGSMACAHWPPPASGTPQAEVCHATITTAVTLLAQMVSHSPSPPWRGESHPQAASDTHTRPRPCQHQTLHPSALGDQGDFASDGKKYNIRWATHGDPTLQFCS